ncbi:MAG: ABC transporter ATP-binding protein, partial [Pseudomonadota bacterium]
QVRAEPPPPPPPSPSAARKPPTGNARRRAEAAEAALARATARLAEIDRRLTDPTLFANGPEAATKLGRERTEAQSTLEAAELEWLEATEAYEALKT